MGKFFQGGKLRSSDTFYVTGTRTLAAATESFLWPGASGASPSFPSSSGEQVKVVSTSANDTAAGTGARTVRLDYYSPTGLRKSETLSLNGVTAVTSTATDVAAVQSLTVLTVGSGGVSAGAIAVKDLAAASVYEIIPGSSCQSGTARYRVPVGKIGYVSALHLSAGATATTVTLKSNVNPVTGLAVTGASFNWASFIVGTDPVTVSPVVPWGPFPANSAIWLVGSHAAGTACQGALEGFIEPA